MQIAAPYNTVKKLRLAVTLLLLSPLLASTARFVAAQAPVFITPQPAPSYYALPPDTTPIYIDDWPRQEPIPHLLSGQTLENGIIVEQPNQTTNGEQLPPGARNGLFQQLYFSGTYLPRFENDSLGFGDFETAIVLGMPFPQPTTPMLITPRFAVHTLDGPIAPDLPARLYDAEVSFQHLRKFGNSPWGMNAVVTLGHYSDFDRSDSDAFRVTGRAVLAYESSPTTTWAAGVAYVNREDVSVVPIAGVIYKPTPYVALEMILPTPRLTWRIPDFEISRNEEIWAYIGGEFGGGVWSITRPSSGMQDLLTYNDLRLLVGLEQKTAGSFNHRFEVGYVFARELQFSSATPDTRLDDTMFVRWRMTY